MASSRRKSTLATHRCGYGSCHCHLRQRIHLTDVTSQKKCTGSGTLSCHSYITYDAAGGKSGNGPNSQRFPEKNGRLWCFQLIFSYMSLVTSLYNTTCYTSSHSRTSVCPTVCYPRVTLMTEYVSQFQFLPRCSYAAAVLPWASVRPSVIRVNCDKTNEISVHILYTIWENDASIVFRYEE